MSPPTDKTNQDMTGPGANTRPGNHGNASPQTTPADQEALLRAFLHHSPAAIAMLDRELRYILVSNRWLTVCGLETLNVVGRNYYEVSPETTREWREIYRRALSGESVHGAEDQITLADGRTSWVEWEVAPWYESDGSIGGIIIFMEVIAERKRTQQELRTHEALLHALVDNLPFDFWAIDPNGRYIAENATAREHWGRLEGKRPEEMGVPDDTKSIWLDNNRRALAGEVVQGEVEYPVGGEVMTFYNILAPIRDADEIRGAVGINIDITERKRTEIALGQSEEKFRGIFENSGLGIFRSTIDGRLIDINLSYARILGYDSVEEATGAIHNIAEDVYVESTRRADIVREILSKEGMSRYENQYKKKDGSIITCTLYVRAVKDESGKVEYLEGFLEDITERKIAEQRQRELDLHKREFYRRTILAATEGKLEITEPGEIEKLAGPAVAEWPIEFGEDLGAVRRAVTGIAEREGMDGSRVYDLALCVGELTTNAFKHAGGGVASLHEVEDRLIFVTSDHGPGMEALTLPEIALKRGFSTAKSLGMGYKAMISVADKVYLATGPSGTTVAIEMRIHPTPRTLTDLGLPDTWD